MKRIILFIAAIAFLNFGAPLFANAQRGGNHSHRYEQQDKRHQNSRKKANKPHQVQKKNHHRDVYYAKDHRYQEPRKYYRKPVNYSQKQYRHGPPAWAKAHRYSSKQHVYFRDYNAFYDPYRGGYVYWSNNNWRFSPTVPAYLAHVNLNRARVHFIQDVPLTARPERYYSRYSKKYPRNMQIHIQVPMPPR